MKINRIFWLVLLIFAFIMGATLGQKDWWILKEIRYKLAKALFAEQKQVLILEKDIDSDGVNEKIEFAVRKYPAGEQFNEGFINIYKDDKKMFSSPSLGWTLKMANVSDINGDGKLEIISKWEEPTVRNLIIYSFDGTTFKELLWASGKDVELIDIDGDKRVDVLEYYQDSSDFFMTIYKWNKNTYAVWKSAVPVGINPNKGKFPRK
jgi:hypothetical protein